MANTRAFCTQCNTYHKTNSKQRKGYYNINHRSPLAETPGDVCALRFDTSGNLIKSDSPRTCADDMSKGASSSKLTMLGSGEPSHSSGLAPKVN